MTSFPGSSSPEDRHAAVYALFDELCDLDARERERRLAALRGAQPEVAAEVEALLRADESAESPLDTPTGLGAPRAERPERIGDFRILGELGRGGMGVVWLAEQDKPRRRVALKVLRNGLLGAEAMSRFAREGDVLGRLGHPSIAKVYEAGTADLGGESCAYLAMELVDGRGLSEWAREARPSLEARVDVLAKIADAVQHAHDRHIVHRDLKPSNLMVDAEGRPRVLDFGVARITDGDDAGSTAVTRTGAVIGTLQYMSPEQVRGDSSAVDGRSDIYALGAIAYELLCGERPYDVGGMAMHRAARVVVDTDPPLLGTRDGELRGDLETIVAKALEKDPRRRYESAARFAEDLRRHASDLPILARPMTRTYRARKFVRRHRILVTATGAVIFALLLGLAGTAWKAREAQSAAARAEERMDRAVEVSRLMTDFFASIDPEREGPDARVLHMIERSEAILDDDGGRSPLVTAALHEAIGRGYLAIGAWDKAERHVRAGLALRESNGAEAWELADSLGALGTLIERSGGAEPAVTRDLLARAALLREESYGPHHPATLEAQRRLARFDWAHGDRTDVIDRLRAILRETEAAPLATPSAVVAARNALAVSLGDAGELTEAAELAERSLEDIRARMGEDHLRTATAQLLVGQLYRELGRPDEAAELFEAALATRVERLGPDHPDVAMVHGDLGTLLVGMRRHEEALTHMYRHLEIMRALREEPSRARFGPLMGVATSLLELGRVDEAASLLEEAERNATPDSGVTDEDRARLLEAIGVTKSWRGDLEGALAAQESANALRLADPDTNKLNLATALYNEGSLLRRLRRPEDALVPLEMARDLEVEVRGPRHPYVATCTFEIGFCYDSLRDYDAAVENFSVAYELQRELFGDGEGTTGVMALRLGDALIGAQRYDDALAAFRSAQLAALTANDEMEAKVLSARALLGLDDPGAARDVLAPAFEEQRDDLRIAAGLYRFAGRVLGDVYTALGDEAALAALNRTMADFDK